MTTGNNNHSRKGPPNKAQLIKYGLIGLLLICVIWFLANFSSIKSTSELGAAYAAQINCSCRYVEGRSAESCDNEAEAGPTFISISGHDDKKRIRASVPFLASEVAEKRGEFGCILLNEEEIDALD